MNVNISDVLDIVNNQYQCRGKEAINLIASKNMKKEFSFTENHQLEINVTNFGIAKELARSLSDKNNIITNYNMLPGDKDAKNPTGLRIGVQEMTRYGMKEDEMGELADLMKAGLQGK